MSYSIEPAYTVYNELCRLILKAGTDPINKWFFYDGSFIPEYQLERIPNTSNKENYVVIFEKKNYCIF